MSHMMCRSLLARVAPQPRRPAPPRQARRCPRPIMGWTRTRTRRGRESLSTRSPRWSRSRRGRGRPVSALMGEIGRWLYYTYVPSSSWSSKMLNTEKVPKVKISFPEQNKFFSLQINGVWFLDQFFRILCRGQWRGNYKNLSQQRMTRKSVWGMGIQLSIFKEIYFYCYIIVLGGEGRTRYP